MLAAIDQNIGLRLGFARSTTRASSDLKVALAPLIEGEIPWKIALFLSIQIAQHIVMMISMKKGDRS